MKNNKIKRSVIYFLSAIGIGVFFLIINRFMNTQKYNILKNNVNIYSSSVESGVNVTEDIQDVIEEMDNSLYISSGLYKVRNLRVSHKNDINISGDGEKSVLQSDDSCEVWDYTMEIEDCDNITLENITFDGNKDIVDGDKDEGVANLYIVNCNNVTIKNCIFKNNGYLNIVLVNSNNVIIQESSFLNSDCGIITSGMPSSNIKIMDNYFDGAAYSEPIAIFGGEEGWHKNILISGNTIKNHIYGSGIGAQAVDNITIEDNVIENCGTGIFLNTVSYSSNDYPVKNAIIRNNVVKNSVYEGLLIKGTKESTIYNNTIEGSKTCGISASNGYKLTIEDNSIINSLGESSVILDHLEDSNIISNNINVKNNQEALIVTKHGVNNEINENSSNRQDIPMILEKE